jgi:hypothetical protein
MEKSRPEESYDAKSPELLMERLCGELIQVPKIRTNKTKNLRHILNIWVPEIGAVVFAVQEQARLAKTYVIV